MGQEYKPVIHRINNKNDQDLYTLVLSLTLAEEIQIH